MIATLRRKSSLFYDVARSEGLASALRRTVRKVFSMLISYPKVNHENEHEHEYLKAVEKSSLLTQQLRLQSDSIRNLAALLAFNQRATQNTLPAPYISVILPVYNRPKQAVSAIKSVLEQQQVSFQLIVIDDGSDQPFSQELEQSLPGAANDERLIIARIDHAGAVVARNHGMSLAGGDVFVFLDSDNLMYPNYLNALADFYRINPNTRIAYAAMLWDDGGDYVHLRHDEFDWQRLVQQTVNLDMNCFSFTREVFQQLGGFDETLTRHSDYDLALRYTQKYMPEKVPAIAAHYYAGEMFPRITLDEPSLPNIRRIHSKFLPRDDSGIRVLIYCYDYPQLSESYVDTEIAWLVRRGVRVEVYSLTAPGACGEVLVPVHGGDLDQVFCEFQPDIVHAHWLNLGVMVAETAARHGVPVTIRGHGFEFGRDLYEEASALESIKSIYLFPHLAASLDPLQACKARPVPACFNSTRFYPRMEKDRRLILRAGACLPTKDIECFIRVAARCPDFRFVLVLAKVANQPDLPDQLLALNESLDNPVDIRFNVQSAEMTKLVSRAGIYMHTFGYVQAFGMPISIAESLACGSALLVRDSPEARAYAGPHSLYYQDEDDAVCRIGEISCWSESDWLEKNRMNAQFAYQNYMDDMVLPVLLDDWRQLAGKPADQPLPDR